MSRVFQINKSFQIPIPSEYARYTSEENTVYIGRQDAKFTNQSRKESGGCLRAAGTYWDLGPKEKSIYCVQKSKFSSQNFPDSQKQNNEKKLEQMLLWKKKSCIGKQDIKFTNQSSGCPRVTRTDWDLGIKEKSIFCVQKSKSSSQNFPHTN